jgi:hypothetical protein
MSTPGSLTHLGTAATGASRARENPGPTDGFVPSTVVCRPSAGPCDVAETCTGSSASCPADTGSPDGDGDGTCDLQDDCPSIPDPGQADSDGDGLGDVCDPCNNTFNGGAYATKSKITVTKLLTAPGDDKVKLKGYLVLPQTPVIRCDLNGVRLLLQKQDGSYIFDTTLPPGVYDTTKRSAGRRTPRRRSSRTRTRATRHRSSTASARRRSPRHEDAGPDQVQRRREARARTARSPAPTCRSRARSSSTSRRTRRRRSAERRTTSPRTACSRVPAAR